MLDDTQETTTIPNRIAEHNGWYLLIGVIMGLILGLVYAWWVNPVVYETTLPASLRTEDKEIYRSLIAQVYAISGNLERAALRLEVLQDEDSFFTLGEQAQQAVADGRFEEAHDLALLASTLLTIKENAGVNGPIMPIVTESP